MNAPETLITSNKLFQLWHVDPKGDSGPPCHDKGNWKLHVRHYDFKYPTWFYVFRRNKITRCAYCGDKGTKSNPVNFSNYDGRVSYHSGCLAKQSKHFHMHDPATCWPCQQKAKATTEITT
jgi:hypothetical protein